MKFRLNPFETYRAGLGAVGLVLLAMFVASDIEQRNLGPVLIVALLVLGQVITEYMPIAVGRGKNLVTMTFSGGFALALVLVAPLGVAMLAQAAAIAGSNVAHGVRKPVRLLFNTGQSAVTAALTAGTFWLVSGTENLAMGDTLTLRQLGAVLAAGLVSALSNHVVVETYLALGYEHRVLPSLVRINPLEILPYGLDIGLAPLCIAVLMYSPLLFPLLLLPAVVMHHSAKLAAAREHEALHDVLTGLPNRALLRQEFTEAISTVEAGETELAVVLLDLDHFKEINDTLGHHTGDLLLCEVSRRLAEVTRDGDTVARLGGDEFAVLATLTPAAGQTEAGGLGARLLEELNQPFTTNGVRLDIAGSVGIAIAPHHGTDLETLMSHADIALYKSKENRGTATIYNPTTDNESPEALALLGELRAAITQNQIEIRYQPTINLHTGTITAIEAIPYWNHPTRGLLHPDTFTELAENTGLATALTTEILRHALPHTTTWHNPTNPNQPPKLTIPISPRHLTDREFPTTLTNTLNQAGVPPTQLTLQIPEPAIPTDTTRTTPITDALHQAGIGLTLTNYGTGNTNITALHHLHITELKLHPTNLNPQILQTITTLTNQLQIPTTTTNLTHQNPTHLKQQGITHAQGPAITPPLTAPQLTTWLTGYHWTKQAITQTANTPKPDMDRNKLHQGRQADDKPAPT